MLTQEVYLAKLEIKCQSQLWHCRLSLNCDNQAKVPGKKCQHISKLNLDKYFQLWITKDLQIPSGIVFIIPLGYDRMHDDNNIGKSGFVLAQFECIVAWEGTGAGGGDC